MTRKPKPRSDDDWDDHPFCRDCADSPDGWCTSEPGKRCNPNERDAPKSRKGDQL